MYSLWLNITYFWNSAKHLQILAYVIKQSIAI